MMYVLNAATANGPALMALSLKSPVPVKMPARSTPFIWGLTKRRKSIKTVCVECGACRGACPFGAIEERSHIVQLIQDLKAENRSVYALFGALFCRSVRAQGPLPVRSKNACRMLGFTQVKEVAVGADMTVISEAEEYVEKVEHGDQKLLTSSCCPAFVATVKRHAPALADCISDTVSPDGGPQQGCKTQ